MPVIQQENGVKAVAGLPLRWGVKAYRELVSARGSAMVGELPERYTRLANLLDDVTDAPLPLDATDAQICIKAQAWAEECLRQTELVHDMDALRRRMSFLCDRKGINPPEVENNRQFVARCCDPAWWRRQLRTIHGRKFEHAAIRLGFVSVRAGAYASDESVKRRIEQNRRNARILQSTILTNDNDQEFKLSELVAKSTSNKAIRRGELMLRIKGFEGIAKECGHDGIFVTLTCPSKFHAVLQGSGKTNPKYEDATPIDGQHYLRKVWARIRSALARAGIALYGFRIAEPHHDGCPHWHMLMFIQPFYRSRSWARNRVARLFKRYAWAESRGEPGCFKQRVDIKNIDWSKGDAAGYIAKYVGKNIDDEHVGEHRDADGIVSVDLAGDEVIKPCQRVEAWAAKWGIRQFQQIGGAPVTVWRELRRIKEETIRLSPGYVKDAWQAAQKLEAQKIGEEKSTTLKAADFAEYLRAQGGAVPGRSYRVKVAMTTAEIQGRYGLALGKKPVGVFAAINPGAVYESIRYRWTRTGRGVAVAFPWTRVNNCTQDIEQELTIQGDFPEEIEDSDWFESAEFRAIELSREEAAESEAMARAVAAETRANTKWTKSLRLPRVNRAR